MVIKRYLLLLLSLLSVAGAIHAGEVDELLAEFSRKPSLSTAPPKKLQTRSKPSLQCSGTEN